MAGSGWFPAVEARPRSAGSAARRRPIEAAGVFRLGLSFSICMAVVQKAEGSCCDDQCGIFSLNSSCSVARIPQCSFTGTDRCCSGGCQCGWVYHAPQRCHTGAESESGLGCGDWADFETSGVCVDDGKGYDTLVSMSTFLIPFLITTTTIVFVSTFLRRQRLIRAMHRRSNGRIHPESPHMTSSVPIPVAVPFATPQSFVVGQPMPAQPGQNPTYSENGTPPVQHFIMGGVCPDCRAPTNIGAQYCSACGKKL